MDELFVEIEIKKEGNETEIYTSVDSFLTLYIYRYLNLFSQNVNLLRFVSTTLPSSRGKVKLNTVSGGLRKELLQESIMCKDATSIESIQDLRLPIYHQRKVKTSVSGTCACVRELVKSLGGNESSDLLGFKQSCLQAPSEVSVWTRFCEIDIVEALGEILLQIQTSQRIEVIPVAITRFEKHMNEPCRMHNIYKVAREHQTQKKDVGSVRSKKQLAILEHRFAEGIYFTIADLLLYPCMTLILKRCTNMATYFPLISAWMNEVEAHQPLCLEVLNLLCDWDYMLPAVVDKSIELPEILDCDAKSLYKSDPKRYKPKNRIYTEQSKVDVALTKLREQLQEVTFSSDSNTEYGESTIDWDVIEPQHELSSALPKERLHRKRQQLENLANAVISLAKPKDRIVDFCSGTGHLGILLALKLPDCTIILMENKPKSLEQARNRAMDLGLDNVRFYQCNIDYLIGNFDFGVSLHACGTATDIVLQQCQRSRAKFVCCPCCYGSIQPMPHVNYPLSKAFRSALSQEDFTYLAHAADQAHETNCSAEKTRQGQLCMDIVDTDRKLKAKEEGYQVILTRLKPEKCTPKNRLLVGWLHGTETCQ